MKLTPILALVLVACSAPAAEKVRPNNEVLTLGERPLASLDERLPPTLVPCFGLHLGLLTTPDDVASDLVLACGRVPSTVGPDCSAYARAATNLGRVAASPQSTAAKRIAAEVEADTALKACRLG